jgi:hypothetical protein
MNGHKSLAYLLLISILFLSSISRSQDQRPGFSGTIVFRDGTYATFNYLGSSRSVAKAVIRGYQGGRLVDVPFEECQEIDFLNKGARYDGTSGDDVLVIKKNQERVTLTNCQVWAGGAMSGVIAYVFNEPATKALKETYAGINNSISQIILGDVGDLKYNPKTKEYFPASYIYDPFTGEKLVWAKRR